MNAAKNIYRAIIDFFPLWIIGGILIGWGICSYGWIRIIIGGLFIYIGLKEVIKDYKLDRQIEKWLRDNDGKLIFFYATRKKIQEKIKSEVIPIFETNILHAYYDGPRIVGDFKEIDYLLKRIMILNPKIKPHNPSILKIENGHFIVKDELKSLMKIETQPIDTIELKRKIKKACT